jgi:hypothetical protein
MVSGAETFAETFIGSRHDLRGCDRESESQGRNVC